MFCMCFKKKCAIDILALIYSIHYMDMNTRQKNKNMTILHGKYAKQKHQQHVLKAQWRIYSTQPTKYCDLYSVKYESINICANCVEQNMNQHACHKTSQNRFLKESSLLSVCVFFSMTLSSFFFVIRHENKSSSHNRHTSWYAFERSIDEWAVWRVELNNKANSTVYSARMSNYNRNVFFLYAVVCFIKPFVIYKAFRPSNTTSACLCLACGFFYCNCDGAQLIKTATVYNLCVSRAQTTVTRLLHYSKYIYALYIYIYA